MTTQGCEHDTPDGVGGSERCHRPGSWLAMDDRAYCSDHVEAHGGKMPIEERRRRLAEKHPGLYVNRDPNFGTNPENWA